MKAGIAVEDATIVVANQDISITSVAIWKHAHNVDFN